MEKFKDLIEEGSKFKKYLYIYNGDDITVKSLKEVFWELKLPLDAGSYKVPGGVEYYTDSKNALDYESLNRKLKEQGLNGEFKPAGGNPEGK